MDNLFSIVSVYLFVLIGYMAKKMFQDTFDEKGIVKLNIYFLLPMLSFWGLLTKKIDLQVIIIPVIYLCITILTLIFSVWIARKLFGDPRDISIVSMASVTGITGSMGIPLGLILFSRESVIYTSLINTASMFFVYTAGVYLYSRGNFGIQKSFFNIFKMPIIWASLAAIILNLLHIPINHALFQTLEMGSFAAIVMQLIIFGAFLYSSRISQLNIKMAAVLLSIKFILIPLLALLILNRMNLDPIALKSILLELIVPIAITNISLASLFDCKPQTVTSLVFLTSLVFIPYVLVLGYFKAI